MVTSGRIRWVASTQDPVSYRSDSVGVVAQRVDRCLQSRTSLALPSKPPPMNTNSQARDGRRMDVVAARSSCSSPLLRQEMGPQRVLNPTAL